MIILFVGGVVFIACVVYLVIASAEDDE